MSCMHVMHAGHACMSCMHVMHACHVCMSCMHAMQACQACMSCMHVMHACHACRSCMHVMRAGHACMSCIHVARTTASLRSDNDLASLGQRTYSRARLANFPVARLGSFLAIPGWRICPVAQLALPGYRPVVSR